LIERANNKNAGNRHDARTLRVGAHGPDALAGGPGAGAGMIEPARQRLYAQW